MISPLQFCPGIGEWSGLTLCLLVRLASIWGVFVRKFFNDSSVFKDNDTVAKAPGPFTSFQSRPVYRLFRASEIWIGDLLGSDRVLDSVILLPFADQNGPFSRIFIEGPFIHKLFIDCLKLL